MQLIDGLSWQWRPDAPITAIDTTQGCTAVALSYPDCAIIRVRPGVSPFKQRPKQGGNPETEDDNDIELQGHLERVSQLRLHACRESADVLMASASSDT